MESRVSFSKRFPIAVVLGDFLQWPDLPFLQFDSEHGMRLEYPMDFRVLFGKTQYLLACLEEG